MRFVTEYSYWHHKTGSQENGDNIFRKINPNSWCPCDGTCPKCITSNANLTGNSNGFDTENPQFNRKSFGASNSPALFNGHTLSRDAFGGPASPLDSNTKEIMESRFDYNFSPVRIYRNTTAARSAESVNASAYTIGSDIVFGQNQYSPGTREGQRLLAHELAHVVQQERGGNQTYPQHVSNLEQAAEAAASEFASGNGLIHVEGASPPMLARQAIQPLATRPRVQLGHLPNIWLLAFGDLIAKHEIVRYLFKSDRLPVGITLEPTRGDSYVARRWTLTWPGPASTYLSELTESGYTLYVQTISGGDEFEEDTQERELEEAKKREFERETNKEHNKTFLPALNMTAEQAMRTLKPGVYVAAPGQKIVPLPPFQPGDLLWQDVPWMDSYKDGYFVEVCIGKMKMKSVSTNPQFWKDMIWLLRLGIPLDDAEKAFGTEWDQLIRSVLIGYALALATASGTGGRADISETAFATATRDASRIINRQMGKVEKEVLAGAISSMGGRANIISKIEILEAVNVALTTYQVYETWTQIKKEIETRKMEQEEDEDLQLLENALALNSSVGNFIMALQDKIAKLPKMEIEPNLRLGERGEVIVHLVLRGRGYLTFSLQNKSGHGIDIIGVNLEKGSIIICDVKSSLGTRSPSLSEAQQNPDEFARSRIERAAAHKGQWQNISEQHVEIANMLQDAIDSGILKHRKVIAKLYRPIPGVEAVKLEIGPWKSKIPSAKALKIKGPKL